MISAAESLLVLQDGMLFSLMWHFCFRGFNAGALRPDINVLPTAALHCSPELTSGSQCMTGLQDQKQSAAQGCSNTTEQTEKRIRSCRRMKQQIQSYWDQTGDSAAQ